MDLNRYIQSNGFLFPSWEIIWTQWNLKNPMWVKERGEEVSDLEGKEKFKSMN